MSSIEFYGYLVILPLQELLEYCGNNFIENEMEIQAIFKNCR